MSASDSQKNLDITHNKQTNRFETAVDGQTGYVSYQDNGDTLVYDHTEVPEALSGRGIGSALIKHALDFARAHDKKVVPQCPFVASYIDKHPDYQDLVA